MTAKTPEQDGALFDEADFPPGTDLAGPHASRQIRRRLTAEPPRAEDLPDGSTWQRAQAVWHDASVPWQHEAPAEETPAPAPKKRSQKRQVARARDTGSVKDAARAKKPQKPAPPAPTAKDAARAKKPQKPAPPAPAAKDTARGKKPEKPAPPAPAALDSGDVKVAPFDVTAGAVTAGVAAVSPPSAPATAPVRRRRGRVALVVAAAVAIAGGGAYTATSGSSESKRASVPGAVDAGALFAADPAAKTDGLVQDLSTVRAADGMVVAIGAEAAGRGPERAQFLVSHNGGRDWALARVRMGDGAEAPPGVRPRHLAGGAGAWAALGSSPTTGTTVWTSGDARTWTRQAAPAFAPKDRLLGLARTATGFVAVGNNAAGRAVVWTSADGRAWQRNDRVNAPGLTGFDRVVANGDVLVAHGTSARTTTTKKKKRKVTTTVRGEGVWRSQDGGRTWAAVNVPQAQGSWGPTEALAAGPGGFFAVREGKRTTGKKKSRKTTRFGVVFASPDGRAWAPVAQLGPPGFGSVERFTGSPAGLVAMVTGQGGKRVLLRSADGRTWQPSGNPGVPIVGALTVAESGIVVAGRKGDDPYLSAGAPVDLTKVPGVIRPDRAVTSLAAGAGRLVAVGGTNGDAAVWTSPAGGQWTRAQTPDFGGGRAGGPGQARQRLTDVAHGQRGWVAVGRTDAPGGTSAPLMATSADGTTWRKAMLPRGGQATSGVVAGPAGHLVVGMSGGHAASWRSTDLKAWTPGHGALGGPTWMRDVAATAKGYVAAGGKQSRTGSLPAIWTSPDGLKWTASPQPALPAGVTSGAYFQVVSRGDTLVALGWGGSATAPSAFFSVSTDAGRTWRPQQPEGGATVTGATATAKGFVLAGTTVDQDAALWASADGAAWRRLPAAPGLTGPGEQRLTALAANGGELLAAGVNADHRGEVPLWWRTMAP